MKNKKATVIILLIVLLLQSFVPSFLVPIVSASAAALNGDGTAENPFQICNIEQLGQIKNGLNKHYILTEDIEFEEGFYWTSLGTTAAPFSGSLDGNGHVIKNLLVDSPYDYASLFGVISNATIKNLTLENVDINGQNYVAALVASAVTNSIIENCSATGEIKGNTYVGGLVGSLSASEVRDSTMSGKINGATNTGGLIGIYNGSGAILNNTFQDGVITGATNTGGLIGIYNGSGAILNNTFQDGVISGSINTGGLIGNYTGTGMIDNSRFHTSVITGTTYTGGFIGIYNGSGTIGNGSIDGEVNGTTTVGGLVGQSTGAVTIDKFSVSGKVIGAGNVGGLVGRMSGGQIQQIFIKADVTATANNAGGIIAEIFGATKIKESTNIGNVQGTNAVGGMIGQVTSGGAALLHVKNGGNVTGTLDYVGGIVGYAPAAATITESINSAAIQGRDYVGGIAGPIAGSSNILNSYNRGDIVGRNYVGGVAGSINVGAGYGVQYCYSTGNISANSYVGGLCGYVHAGKIYNSLALGERITANAYTYRVAYLKSATLNNVAYEDMIVTVAGVIQDIKSKNPTFTSADGLNAELSKITANKTYLEHLSWDFENVWKYPDVGNDFPILRNLSPLLSETPVTGITIKQQTRIIQLGDSDTIKASVIPVNADNQGIAWSSDNSSIVTVTDAGLITAKAIGSTVITARAVDGGFTASCTVIVKETGEISNIALNRTITGDSVSSPNVAANAVDGDNTTRWTAKTNTHNVNLTIDFKEAVVFEEIRVKEHFDRITNFKLQYFDGTEFVDFYTGSTIGNDFVLNYPQFIQGAPITTTKINLLAISTKNPGTGGASIFEFEVYGYVIEPEIVDPDLPINLALKQNVTASVTSGSNHAGNVVDGNLETRWLAPNSSVGAWLEIDFGENVLLNRINLKEAHLRISAYELQYIDGTAWRTFHTGTDIGVNAIIDFERIETSKIRLVVTELKGLNGASIAEIETYYMNKP
jgi:hypothetical protein